MELSLREQRRYGSLGTVFLLPRHVDRRFEDMLIKEKFLDKQNFREYYHSVVEACNEPTLEESIELTQRHDWLHRFSGRARHYFLDPVAPLPSLRKEFKNHTESLISHIYDRLDQIGRGQGDDSEFFIFQHVSDNNIVVSTFPF